MAGPWKQVGLRIPLHAREDVISPGETRAAMQKLLTKISQNAALPTVFYT